MDENNNEIKDELNGEAADEATASDADAPDADEPADGDDTGDTEELSPEEKKKAVQREILEWIKAIATAVILAFVLRQFVLSVVMVDGDSMKNTLHDRERLLVWELAYKPSQGDIVIFEPPITPTGETVGKVYYVKRVIATEGQTVTIDFDSNTVTVDGETLDEYYIKSDEADVMEQKIWNNVEEYVVPEGEVFVMGDNRNNSFDSRAMGCVEKERILGKVLIRFWPLNKFGTVR